jgi:ferredoxin
MVKKKVVLTFPKNLVSQPIIYHLVRKYDLVTNILRAQVMPDEEGKMLLELEGTPANLEQGLRFLREQPIHLQLLGKDIRITDERCIDCGSCTAVCGPKALSLNKQTWKLEFDRSKCVLCGLCVITCPIKAIQVTF